MLLDTNKMVDISLVKQILWSDQIIKQNVKSRVSPYLSKVTFLRLIIVLLQTKTCFK